MSALVLAALLTAATDQPLRDDGGRVRAGLSLQGGFGNTLSSRLSVVADVEVRLGYQITSLLSAYALVRGHVLSSGSGFGIIGGAAEATLGDHFFFGVGALVAAGRVFELDFSTGQTLGTPATLAPGFNLRIGLATASSGKPPRFTRYGLSFGFDLLGMLMSDLSRGTTRLPPTWVFTPMISLGMDWR